MRAGFLDYLNKYFTVMRRLFHGVGTVRTPTVERQFRCTYQYTRITKITHYQEWAKLYPPPLWRCSPTQAMTSSFFRFLDHTQRRTTVGRTPLDARSARHRDLYLTAHNTHNRQKSMSPVGFETTISAVERP